MAAVVVTMEESMPTSLHFLILDDSPTDVELVLHIWLI